MLDQRDRVVETGRTEGAAMTSTNAAGSERLGGHGRAVPLGSARLIPLLVAAAIATGCAGTRISDRQEYQGEKLARPAHILVHDFAARAADLPAWSEAAATFASNEAAATPEEIEAGRQLGVQMANRIVERIDAMGLDAQRAADVPTPTPGDIVIVGFLGSIDEGSGFKRVVLGFGSGSAEVSTHVEGYRALDGGYEKLGSGTADNGKKKSPGLVVPTLVTIATKNPIGLLVMTPVKLAGEVTGKNTVEGVGKKMADDVADELEVKFREQGWIAD